MARSSPEEAIVLISDWFRSLGLADTEMKTELRDGDYPDEPPWRIFQFRPSQNKAFDLDIQVSDDGCWGMGIMHPKHSDTVYAWGFESTQASCKTVLQLARQISAGRADLVVPKFELAKSVGWLELPDEAFKKLRDLTRHDRVRRRNKERLLRKRIPSEAWR